MAYRQNAAPLFHAPPPEPPMVRLVDLAPARKRQLWAWIKAHDAPMAAWLDALRDDPLIHALDGTPRLPLAYIKQAIG